MDYKNEIIKAVSTISNDQALQFFYAMLRLWTSDPDMDEALVEWEQSFADLA